MTTAMRETWTDERLDDLNLKVDRGFELMERRFERIDDKFDRIDERFDALYRLILQLGGGALAALIGILGVLLARL
jgi:tetrahydromethanopterin S-methyltransferase subunit G